VPTRAALAVLHRSARALPLAHAIWYGAIRPVQDRPPAHDGMLHDGMLHDGMLHNVMHTVTWHRAGVRAE